MKDTTNIPQGWLDLVRHTLSRLTNNKGSAIVTITVIVQGNKPIEWIDAEVQRIHPLEAAIHYPEYLQAFLPRKAKVEADENGSLDIGGADNRL